MVVKRRDTLTIYTEDIGNLLEWTSMFALKMLDMTEQVNEEVTTFTLRLVSICVNDFQIYERDTKFLFECFSTLEEKFRISKRPCNFLFII